MKMHGDKTFMMNCKGMHVADVQLNLLFTEIDF